MTTRSCNSLLDKLGRETKAEIQRYKGLGEMSTRAALENHHEPRNPHHDSASNWRTPLPPMKFLLC